MGILARTRSLHAAKETPLPRAVKESTEGKIITAAALFGSCSTRVLAFPRPHRFIGHKVALARRERASRAVVIVRLVNSSYTFRELGIMRHSCLVLAGGFGRHLLPAVLLSKMMILLVSSMSPVET